MFRCYSRRFKFFKGEICIQAKIGRTEILRVYRPKRGKFHINILKNEELQHRYSKTNIKQLCPICPISSLFETRENSHVQLSCPYILDFQE